MWELDYKESWAPKNWCFWTVVLEKTLESPLDCKEIQPVHSKRDQSWNVHWKDWCWSWNSNTLASWCEQLTHLKRPWCCKRLKVGGEGDNRGDRRGQQWDGWMASPTRWTWVWVESGSWWWTGRPGVLRFIESQRVRHDWVTELNWCVRKEHTATKHHSHISLLITEERRGISPAKAGRHPLSQVSAPVRGQLPSRPAWQDAHGAPAAPEQGIKTLTRATQEIMGISDAHRSRESGNDWNSASLQTRETP